MKIGGHSPKEVAYHVMLLNEAGLIVDDEMSITKYCLMWLTKRLTWNGHQFLESSKHEGIWQKAKKITAERTGGLSFDVLKSVLIKLLTEAVMG